jgi:hypothetical protein
MAPALALWPDKNPGAGVDAGERLSRLLRNSSYYCIKDAEHWPQWEKPEDHDGAVIEFLERPVAQPAQCCELVRSVRFPAHQRFHVVPGICSSRLRKPTTGAMT